MQESALTAEKKNNFKLALRFTVNQEELQHLCRNLVRLIEDEAAKGQSTGMIAVKISRAIKLAVDIKFEDKLINDEEHPVIHEGKDPEFNSFKANIVRGMFITFVEHPQGFPGFFDILSGIAGAGLGLGKIKIAGHEDPVKFEALKQFYPEAEKLRIAQIELIKTFMCPEKLAAFPSIRLGTYTVLTGCALLPFYSACEKLRYPEQKDSEACIESACNIVKFKFSGNSECMNKFFSQNLFKVLFEELFAHESTVFSIFQ